MTHAGERASSTGRKVYGVPCRPLSRWHSPLSEILAHHEREQPVGHERSLFPPLAGNEWKRSAYMLITVKPRAYARGSREIADRSID